MESRCKNLRNAASIMQQLDYKLSSHKWPINCASPEDVKDVPLAIAKSEWAGYHSHYMNIAAKIDGLDNRMREKFNSITAKENTFMKNFESKIDNLENTLIEKFSSEIGNSENTLIEKFSSKIGNSENTLIEKFSSKIGNSENTLKEFKKSVSNYNIVMLNEIRKLEDSGKLEDTVEITLQIIQALATVLDDYTGNFEDQTKTIQTIEAKIEDMVTPTEEIKTIVSLVQTAMIQLLNETRLKESKDCPGEIGKEVNSNNELTKILLSLRKS